MEVKLYGFGSHFTEKKSSANDVDLLILHENNKPSIIFARTCKALLKRKIPKSDIVMLSQSEERDLDFVARANATFLVSMSPDTLTDSSDAIAAIS